MDWNLLRSFIAVVETGSLSSAARRLGLSQPTLGRHIKELQGQLGLSLLQRKGQSQEPTRQGRVLFEQAKRMQLEADIFLRKAASMEKGMAGEVRLSASEAVACLVLPNALAALRRRWPKLQLVVEADNRQASLLRRDADIALRMVRPRELDLVAKKICDVPLGLFAHQKLLQGASIPKRITAGAPLGFGGYISEKAHLRWLAEAGMQTNLEDFSLRSDSDIFLAHSILAGVVAGPMQKAVARQNAGLLQIFDWLDLKPLELWLVAHPDLHTTPRVRAVFDSLGEELAAFYSDNPPTEGHSYAARPSPRSSKSVA